MEKYTAVLDWIDSQQREMLEQLQAWANINSHSFNISGLQQQFDELKKAFGVFGEDIEQLKTPPLKNLNSLGQEEQTPLGDVLYLQKRPKAKHQVLLVCHMDTVYALDHPFQKITLKDEKTLQGPGVTDAKGGIMVLLKTLEAFEQSDNKYDVGWQVLINSDEEIGSPGSSALFEKYTKSAQIGLVYEPSLPDGQLVGSRKGSGNFILVVRGQAAHAGRDFDKGRNAISAASKCVVEIDHLTGSRDGLTINMGKIEGGRAGNIVADLAILRLNIRVLEKEDQDYVSEEIKKIVKTVSKEQDVQVDLLGGFSAPPKPLDEATLNLLNKIKHCGQDLGVVIDWTPSGGVCDGNRLAAAGLPTVDSLGVRGDKIHSDEEYLCIESLSERVKISTLFLMKLANGELS